MNLIGVLEGLLFVVGDEGLTLKQICDILEINLDEAKKLLKELKNQYDDDKTPYYFRNTIKFYY